MRTALLTVYLALFLILIGTCYRKSWKAWHVPAKCANSAGFIALLLAGLALRGKGHAPDQRGQRQQKAAAKLFTHRPHTRLRSRFPKVPVFFPGRCRPRRNRG